MAENKLENLESDIDLSPKLEDSEKITFGALEEKSKKEDSTWDNIFNDFDTDKSLKTEVSKLTKENNKDFYFYIKGISKVFQILFWIMLILVVLFWTYVYIQKNEKFNNQSILNPICFLFNWELELWWNCSSISYLENELNNKFDKISDGQAKNIWEILEKIYVEKNYLNTKDILFLKNKSVDKLKVIEILSKFDELKDNYTWKIKNKIMCDNVTIDKKEKILKASCEAFSMWFENNIIGFDWTSIWNANKVKWTSISLANSFLNYIEKEGSKDFILLENQKTFTNEKFIWEDWYTKKTKFDLKLKINF